MGIHGSATCVMSFDGAQGWLVGEPHRGLDAMFAMMNSARLHVAMQGLGHAENAHQNALRYAHERVQSRVAVRPAGAPPPRGADPIAWHPAMRRTLWRQRVLVEGSRLVAYETAHLLDLSERALDAHERAAAHDQVSLLTPVLKAFLTDNGFGIASEALQVFGGHGYVHDWGIEQCVRDSRIAMIYEGTNEIQAIDLLVRKVLPDGAAKFLVLLARLDAGLPAQARHTAAARQAIAQLRLAARELVRDAALDPELAYRVAGDFLRATGLALVLQGWARAQAVSEPLGKAGDAFHQDKCTAAEHCFAYVRPELEHALRIVCPRSRLARQTGHLGVLESEHRGVLVDPVDVVALGDAHSSPHRRRQVLVLPRDLVPLVVDQELLFAREGRRALN